MAYSISQSPKFFFETNNKNFIIETKAILSIRNKKKKNCSINWERSLYIIIALQHLMVTKGVLNFLTES